MWDITGVCARVLDVVQNVGAHRRGLSYIYIFSGIFLMPCGVGRFGPLHKASEKWIIPSDWKTLLPAILWHYGLSFNIEIS